MSSQKMSSNVMRDSARVIATELIREPVRQAVRDALYEEIATIKSESGEETVTLKSIDEGGSSSREQSSDKKQSGGGRSKLTMFGVILAIAGVAFLARRRMSSTGGSAWSERSPGAVAADDAEGGYVSEGEMQTAETSDQSGRDTEGTGTSPSTTTDR